MSLSSVAEVVTTDRMIENLVEPLQVTPEQFLNHGGRRLREGERRLMAAVLEDAIVTLARYADAVDDEGSALHRETLEWIETRNGRDLFCFQSVCDHLGIDPDYLRQGLRRWREAHSAQRSELGSAARAGGFGTPVPRRRPIDKTAIRTGALRVRASAHAAHG